MPDKGGLWEDVMEEVKDEKSALRAQYQSRSVISLAGNLDGKNPDQEVIKEVLNQKIKEDIELISAVKDIKVLLNKIKGIAAHISPENQLLIEGLREIGQQFVKDKIKNVMTPLDLKVASSDIKLYEEIYPGGKTPLANLFENQKKIILQNQAEALRNPEIPLEEKLMLYKRAEGSAVFNRQEMDELKKVFENQVMLKINQINSTSSLKDILVLNLCVKALNNPEISAAFQSIKDTLKNGITETSSMAHLDAIHNDKHLTVVEKGQRIDGMLSVYFSLHGDIPEGLAQVYAELSEKYKNQMVGELRAHGTGLFSNIDVDSMQRQALTKDKSQKKPAGETDAGRPLSKGFNSISAGVVRSVLENGDFNAGILSVRRWIETAATMYQQGDFYSAHAIMTGLSNFPKYMDAINSEKGLHAALKISLDDLLSSGKAYKNIRAAERLEVEAGNNEFLPSISYKFSDMTFFYDGNAPKEVLNAAGTKVMIDKRPLLLEPYYEEFRSKKVSLGEAPEKDLAQTFGTAEPLDEKTMHLYSATVFEIEGKEPLVPASESVKSISDVQRDLTDKQQKISAHKAPPKEKVTDELAQAYNEHMKSNGGISNNFKSTPEYLDHSKLEALREAYKAKHDGNEKGFHNSPEYVDYLKEKAKAQTPNILQKEQSYKNLSSPALSSAKTSVPEKAALSKSLPQEIAETLDKEEKRDQKWASFSKLPTARASWISSATSSPVLGGRHREQNRNSSTPEPLSPLPESLPAVENAKVNQRPESQGDSTVKMAVLTTKKGTRLPSAPPPPRPNDTNDDMEQKQNAEESQSKKMPSESSPKPSDKPKPSITVIPIRMLNKK